MSLETLFEAEQEQAFLEVKDLDPYTRKLPKTGAAGDQPGLRAYALGGLGGFNAHIAGFLQASLDKEARGEAAAPALITCSSGAIWWVYRYLDVKHHRNRYVPDQLKCELADQAKKETGLNALIAAAFGDPGIFRPDYTDYFLRFLQYWPLKAWNWIGGLSSPAAEEYFNRVLPSTLLIPERTDKDYQDIAAAFINSECQDDDPEYPGVMFNTYDLQSGIETVHCNRKALRLTDLKGDVVRSRHDGALHRLRQGKKAKPIVGGGGSHPVVYKEIDPNLKQAGKEIEKALWLLWYGIDDQHWELDGAYHRQMIVSELNACSEIYAIKPQPDSQRKAPKNYFDVMDLQTEMWFNAAYAAEVAEMNLWAHNEGRQPATIIPITMHRPMGYFNYFVEKVSIFDRAYKEAFLTL